MILSHKKRHNTDRIILWIVFTVPVYTALGFFVNTIAIFGKVGYTDFITDGIFHHMILVSANIVVVCVVAWMAFTRKSFRQHGSVDAVS